MEEELRMIDREIELVGETVLDITGFITLIQLFQARTQLLEDDRSLKPFSETVKLLGLDEKHEMKLVSLRNAAVHNTQGIDAEIRSNENWIREIFIPSVLKMDFPKTSFKDDIILTLERIGADYGYQIDKEINLLVGSSCYDIDVTLASKEIRAIGEIKERPTPGARATGIRQLEAYMTGMKENYGVLILGNQSTFEEMEEYGKSMLIIGGASDLRKVFEWLDTQASYIRRGRQYELFDWSGKDFKLGKKLALFWIKLLTQIVKGEIVNNEEAVIEYAHDELELDLSTEAVRELYQIGGENQGLFYRMGFDGREDTWTSIDKPLALDCLKKERKRIRNLTPNALVERWIQIKVNDKVTLVPTSSMDFEKQVLILRAYVVLSRMGSEPVHYKRVMTITKLARTQVSGVNAFFVGLGFLSSVEKGTYLPAKEVVEFYTEKPGAEDYSSLQPVLRTSSLYDRISSLILVHGKATENDLIDYLLEESGETTKSRAKRALDWLERAGLITIDENEEVELIE